MALLRVEYSSKSLGMNTSFQVFLPDEGDLKETKVVYLLHGLTDNCTGWTRYSSCERYARERGVALVIPEVQRSFYIDGVYGLKYFTYVSGPEMDGTRNEKIAADREKYSNEIKYLLDKYRVPYECIGGDYLDRFTRAKEIIAEKLHVTTQW